MKINGTPQPGDKVPRKKITPPNGNPSNGDGNKGGSGGCLPALVTIAVLGGGWISMLLTGSGWTA